jgi:hypothetical protein
MICRFIGIFAFAVSGLFSQEQPATPPPDAAAATKPATPPAEAALTPAPAAVPKPDYVIDPGTKIPLSLINSVSTKNSTEGDRVYWRPCSRWCCEARW